MSRSQHLPRASRRGNITKRSPHGRIIKVENRPDGRIWSLHATKGWRSNRSGY